MDNKAMPKAVEAEHGGLTPHHSSPHFKIRNILAQLIAASSKYLIMLNIGMGISFPTVAIPPMLNAREGLSINEDESSWFASLVFIFQPIGSIATVSLSRLGRKMSMFYLQVPLLIGWILPFFAESVWELYMASAVMGLGIGFMQAPVATYIGEITQPKYRGLMACIAFFFLTLGSVCVYAIYVLLENWRQTSLYCALIPILTAVLLYIIPESPVWLVAKGRHSEAKKALAWLRGWVSESDVEAEFKAILYHNDPKYAAMIDSEIPSVSGGFELDHADPRGSSNYNTMTKADQLRASTESVRETTAALASSEENQSRNADKKSKYEEPFSTFIRRPEMYRPLFLSAVFMLISNGIGVATFRSYLVLIFKEFHVSIDENIATVGVMMIGLIGNIISVILMPVCGKRNLSLVAIVFCGIGFFLFGFYSFFGKELNMTWVPIAIMILIFFATNLGVGHIPWVLMSEIFPLRGRTHATAGVAGYANFLQFLGTKLFPTFNQYLTLGGTFFMYGGTEATYKIIKYEVEDNIDQLTVWRCFKKLSSGVTMLERKKGSGYIHLGTHLSFLLLD